MLDQPTDLTLWERDKIKLDFALFVAKRARRFHVEPVSIIDVIAGRVSGDIARIFSPGGATEKAQPPAPEGEHRPVSPSPITEAPTPLPDADERHRPAEAKTSDQEPSVSDGSAGMQDRCESIPAPSSPAKAPVSDEGRTTGKSTRAKAFVAPAGEQNERTMKRLEVASLHEAEPWLTPDEAAMRLFIPVVNLRIFSTELEITWSHPRPQTAAAPAPLEVPRTVQQKVTAMHRMHPTWTARLIAQAIGAPLATVSTYLTVARKVVADEQARAA